MKNETDNVLALDLVSLPISVIGGLIAIGAWTLHTTHLLTAVIGLVILLIGKTQLLSFQFTISNVTPGAAKLWFLIFFGMLIFFVAATAHALAYILL